MEHLNFSNTISQLKSKIVNELDGTAPQYQMFRHISGGYSLSDALVDELMQAAYEEGMKGRERSI